MICAGFYQTFVGTEFQNLQVYIRTRRRRATKTGQQTNE